MTTDNLSVSLPLSELRNFLTASKKLWSGKEISKNHFNNGLIFTKLNINPFEKFIAITTGGYTLKQTVGVEGNLCVGMPIGIQAANSSVLSEMEIRDYVKKEFPIALLQLEKAKGEIITFTQDADRCNVTIDGEKFTVFRHVFFSDKGNNQADNFLSWAISSLEGRFTNQGYTVKIPVVILEDIVKNVEQVFKVSKSKFSNYPKCLLVFQLNAERTEYDLMIDTNVATKYKYLPGTNYWYSGYSIPAPENATDFCMLPEQIPYMISYIGGDEIELVRHLATGDARGLLHITGTDPAKKIVAGVAAGDKDLTPENAPGVWVEVPNAKKSVKVQMDAESAKSLREYIEEVKANPMADISSPYWKI